MGVKVVVRTGSDDGAGEVRSANSCMGISTRATSDMPVTACSVRAGEPAGRVGAEGGETVEGKGRGRIGVGHPAEVVEVDSRTGSLSHEAMSFNSESMIVLLFLVNISNFQF